MEFNDLTSASHMSLLEAEYGSGDGQSGSEISEAVSGVTTPGASRLQASQLQERSATTQRLLLVVEAIMTLLLESPRTPLDHRALAGVSLVLSHFAFPPRLHVWHLPSGQKITLQSVLMVVIDICLEFILVLIVVSTPDLTLNPVENLPPQVNLVPNHTLCLILKTAAAEESR